MEVQTLINDHTLNAMPQIFTREEILRLLDLALHPKKPRNDLIGKWCAMRNHLILFMSYKLAVRPLEICSLKFNDIDYNNMLVNIPPEGNKLHKGRIIPLPASIIKPLQDYRRESQIQWWIHTSYLFPSLQNTKLSRDRWTEIFGQIKRDAGINHGTPYTLRHTQATEFYEKTGDIMALANLLGHTDLESTKVYVHLATIKGGYFNRMRNAIDS